MLRTMWPKPCTKDGRHCHDKAINSYWRVSILCKMLSKIPISIYARVCVSVCAQSTLCADSVCTQKQTKSKSHHRTRDDQRHLVSIWGDLSEPARVNVPNEYSIGAESRQAETQKSSINCLRKDIIVIQFNRAPEIRNSISSEKSGKEK